MRWVWGGWGVGSGECACWGICVGRVGSEVCVGEGGE